MQTPDVVDPDVLVFGGPPITATAPPITVSIKPPPPVVGVPSPPEVVPPLAPLETVIYTDYAFNIQSPRLLSNISENDGGNQSLGLIVTGKHPQLVVAVLY